MELNGKPFIPPNCPTDQHGAPITLSPDNFHLIVDDFEHFAFESRPITVVLGYFGEVTGSGPHENGDHVEVGVVEVSRDSDEARQAHAINGDQGAIRRMGGLFCERVMNCRGVIDGECWALGARAVIEVVREVSETNP